MPVARYTAKAIGTNAASTHPTLPRTLFFAAFIVEQSKKTPNPPKSMAHAAKNAQRGSTPQPYAMSATLRNLSENASSTTPSTTLTRTIHSPERGIFLIHWGKRAKSVKGNANARAKPSMHTTGASTSPSPTTLTSIAPTIGAVHEKLTTTSVSAIKKTPINPPIFSALSSSLPAHDCGNCNVNAPSRDSPKTTKTAKHTRLNTAFVANWFMALAPISTVIATPRVRNITTMQPPYTSALLRPEVSFRK